MLENRLLIRAPFLPAPRSSRKSLGIFLSIIDAGINIVTLADNRVYTAQKTELVDLLTSLVIMSRAARPAVSCSFEEAVGARAS
jgi:hypothetical protein